MEGGEAEGGAGQLQQGVLTVRQGAQDTQLTLRDTGQQGEVEGERGRVGETVDGDLLVLGAGQAGQVHSVMEGRSESIAEE